MAKWHHLLLAGVLHTKDNTESVSMAVEVFS